MRTRFSWSRRFTVAALAVALLAACAFACGRGSSGSAPAPPDGGAGPQQTGDGAIADGGPAATGNIPPASWATLLAVDDTTPWGIAERDDGHLLVAVGGNSLSTTTAKLLDVEPSAGGLVATSPVCPMRDQLSFAALGSGEALFGSLFDASNSDLALSYGRTAADGGVAFAKTVGTGLSAEPMSVSLGADKSSYIVSPTSTSGTTSLIKLDAAGATLWSKSYAAIGSYLALDAAGNLVLGASAADNTNFGGGPLSGSVLVGLAPDGTHLWSHAMPTEILALASGPPGVAVVTGASTVLDGNAAAPAARDLDVVALGTTGQTRWAKRIAVHGDADTGPRVSVGKDGTTFVSLALEGTVDFGAGALGSDQVASRVAALAAYAADGTLLWSGLLHSLLDLRGSAAPYVTSDAAGNVFLAAFTSAPLDLGNGTSITPTTQRGVFVAELPHR